MINSRLLLLIFDGRVYKRCLFLLFLLVFVLLVCVLEVPFDEYVLFLELFVFLFIGPNVDECFAASPEDPVEFTDGLTPQRRSREVMDDCDADDTVDTLISYRKLQRIGNEGLIIYVFLFCDIDKVEAPVSSDVEQIGRITPEIFAISTPNVKDDTTEF